MALLLVLLSSMVTLITSSQGAEPAAEVYQRDENEKHFKLDYCENQSITEVIAYNQPMEKNCLYVHSAGDFPLSKMQGIPSGTLVRINGSVAFINKTFPNLADGEILPVLFVKANGTKSYRSPLGNRTVKSLKFLEEGHIETE